MNELNELNKTENCYNFIEMKQKDIKPLREKMWLMNNKKCPVLNIEIDFDKTTLDHAHMRKGEEYSPNKGVIREVLDFRVNAALGKLENALKRVGLSQQEDFDIGTFLRNAADYFDKGAYKDEEGNMYIHPREVKKDPLLKKSLYNKLKKAYIESGKKAKFPDYPKTKKLTKKLEKLLQDFGMYDLYIL